MEAHEMSANEESITRVFLGFDVRHGFFGRQGGVSSGLHASLNCGRGSSDHRDNVAQNLHIVADYMNVSSGNVMTLHQHHSADCLYIDAPWELEGRPKADAMVTDCKGIALGVLTADCAPVLFCAQKKDGTPIIGAAHAGWKGALGGILESTVATLQEYGAVISTIKAAIGPCLAQESFEVSCDFKEVFLEEKPENQLFFIDGQKPENAMFDLKGYCRSKLEKLGVREVFVSEDNTYIAEDHYFSYRRTTHRSEPDYGRQISVVVL